MNIKQIIRTDIDLDNIKLPYRPTHVMCNQQARIILANDGLEIQHKVLELYRAHLDAGVVWPD
ncbi:MAG: hypothetical protein ACM3NT_06005, partial [Methylocystaceae bacterium]